MRAGVEHSVPHRVEFRIMQSNATVALCAQQPSVTERRFFEAA
jgi:hypothetical protein